MHILFLSDNFPPEVNAPATRTFEHCREWVKTGHRVTVITGAPNFPTGRVFGGYRNLPWQTEDMAGIRVIRVWTYITANAGFGRRILDYMSFMVTATLAALYVGQVDLVIATSPQLFSPCAAYVVSRFKRRPYVFELRDLWPESIRAVGAMRDSRLLRMLERLELFLYHRAAAVVCVTRSFRSNLIGRGIEPGKLAVVTNGVDRSRFRPGPKDVELAARLGLEGKFVAGYVGTHGMAHGLETVLDAAALMRTTGRRDRFRFLLLGEGARKAQLIEKASSIRLDNVLFLDSVPREEVVRYWSLIDVSIIHLRRQALFKTVIPSKLFESLSLGIPVLHGVEGESAEIVSREGLGLEIEPENARSLLDGLIRLEGDQALYQRLRANCLDAAPRYDRTARAGEMLCFLEAVARGDRPLAVMEGEAWKEPPS